MIGRISHSLIPAPLIQQRIGSVFPDSITLNNQLKFVSVGETILAATGYLQDELFNNSINILSRSTNLEHSLLEKLSTGYFAEEPMEIQTRNGDSLLFCASGFYLGQISDYHGVIILRLENQDELHFSNDPSEVRTSEIDRFVYVSAHSLRGPLATMKGLINLAKTYSDSKEISFLVNQMDHFAEKLDNHLHKLIYFAESDKGYEASSHHLSLYDIVKTLHLAVGDFSLSQQIGFRCVAPDLSLALENGEVVLSLLRNLVMFFCQQHKSENNDLQLDVHSDDHRIELALLGVGFSPIDVLKSKLSAINFSYSEILNYPELINFYAAKKIICRLRGNMKVIIKEDRQISVLITIPRNILLH